ncbi:rhiE, partial [Cucurbita argyrosperma subsp. argyrosperma]
MYQIHPANQSRHFHTSPNSILRRRASSNVILNPKENRKSHCTVSIIGIHLIPKIATIRFILSRSLFTIDQYALSVSVITRNTSSFPFSVRSSDSCFSRNFRIEGLTMSSRGVRLQIRDHHVVVDNGILQLTLSKPDGIITGIRYNGVDNLLEVLNPESNRGYWDIVWNSPGSQGIFDVIKGSSFRVIVENEEQVELSFTRMWDPSLEGKVVPLNIDKRFIVLRGSSGFYSYAIYEHLKDWPDFDIADNRQRLMPLPDDRLSGRCQTLGFPEAVLLTHPKNPEHKDEVDDKYQYSCENKDLKVHGWISTNPPIGFWQITPSDEFRSGGPHKQSLTSHVGPTTLAIFLSTHYAGQDLVPKFRNGEPWKKVFGPVFLYLNSTKAGDDPFWLWEDAKIQMMTEVQSWPYSFPASDDFPKLDQRGTISGRLLVFDRYMSRDYLPAGGAFVGLSAPGEIGSWQRECKGYQFWTRADDRGYFIINHVHIGQYNLYAWVPGFIGDYRCDALINISQGSSIELGDLVYEPPRDGPTLWEIGIPDRSASEFYVPDPNPLHINKLFVNHPERFRQYGLWERYAELYPDEDLVYTVGTSDYSKDWFFAQVPRKTNDNSHQGTTWKIAFKLDRVDRKNRYMLRVAIASATLAELQIRVNDPSSKRPLFTSGLIGRDNSIARHGIHGIYWLYSVGIAGLHLVEGDNAIFFTQPRCTSPFQGIILICSLVRVNSKLAVVMENGIIAVTISNPMGFVTGIQYHGIENLLDVTNPEDDRGYWDVVWNTAGAKGTKGMFDRIEATDFKVIVQNDEQIELSFSRAYNSSSGDDVVPLNVDKRFVILRNSSGFYSYAIYEHLKDWPAFNIDNTRIAFKPRKDKFRYMVVADERQRFMPLPDDRKPPRGVALEYPEAVLLVDPIEPEFKGEVDDKYQYGCESKDTRVHGWISNDPPIGIWQITASEEYRSGGPLKQVLTSHVGPTSLTIHSDFGKMLKNRYVSNESIPASGAYVGLALPGELGSWQTESKGYQFWSRADENGHFTLENVLSGNYSLNGWVYNFISEYQYDAFITVTPGSDIDVGELVFEPPRDGPTLWEIGIPDRTAAEFYVPDPSPKFINKLFVNHSDKFRQYGLWERYAELYPKEDLVYTVNQSDYKKDWFFAQVNRKIDDNNTYVGTTWKIEFKIDSPDTHGTYKLRLALATAHAAELQVRVNDAQTVTPLFTTGVIGKDNTIARHGIHGLYRFYSVDIPGSELVAGNNTIFLTQTNDHGPFVGIMYDYIRLEGPLTS